MNTKYAFFAVVSLLSLIALPLAAAGQTEPSRQGGTAPSLHPFGTLPRGFFDDGRPVAGFGQPPWLAATTVAAFPGDVLLNDQPPFLAGVNVDHSTLAYREGETLTVKFTAEREAYLYLLYHQADGSSYLLFPNEAHIDNHVPAGKWVTIPAADQSFRFRVSPPFGREVLQVLATLKPAAELDDLVRKRGRAAPVTREQLVALHERLRQDRSTWAEHRMAITTTTRAAELPRARRPASAFLSA